MMAYYTVFVPFGAQHILAVALVVGAAAALAVGLKTRSVLPVLATGMITLWLLRYLVG